MLRSQAEQLLRTELNCYGEGLEGIPEEMLVEIAIRYPDLRTKTPLTLPGYWHIIEKAIGSEIQYSLCVLCDKELELVARMQPYGGGEMRFIFAFGSEKFDWSPGATSFVGTVCDDCAEPITKKMQCNVKNPWEKLDSEDS